jgi:hypothetical protein
MKNQGHIYIRNFLTASNTVVETGQLDEII